MVTLSNGKRQSALLKHAPAIIIKTGDIGRLMAWGLMNTCSYAKI